LKVWQNAIMKDFLLWSKIAQNIIKLGNHIMYLQKLKLWNSIVEKGIFTPSTTFLKISKISFFSQESNLWIIYLAVKKGWKSRFNGLFSIIEKNSNTKTYNLWKNSKLLNKFCRVGYHNCTFWNHISTIRIKISHYP
jgi:hypothetical protein